MTNGVLEATFRASRQYELLAYERLAVSEQDALRDSTEDPDFYGVLRPLDDQKPLKAVCKDTALLFLTLREPSSLPAYVKKQFGTECEKAILELLFDGILEIELQGNFINGPAVMAALEIADRKSKSDKISQLSVRALRHAQLLRTTDLRSLWSRLYLFGREPLTPALKRSFNSIERVEKYLGLGPQGSLQPIIEKHWRIVPPRLPDYAWTNFRTTPEHNDLYNSPFGYKLYISPTFNGVAQTFEQIVRVLAEGPPSNFKVASDIHGLLRSDKLVVYYPSLELLYESVQVLKAHTAGLPSQGVPFTASLTDDGFLSWGADPPSRPSGFEGLEKDSWRSWVTRRLATHLAAAKAVPTEGLEPWQFALNRLESEGVDAGSWIPPRQVWQASPQ